MNHIPAQKIQAIQAACLKEKGKNPILIAEHIMEEPFMSIHGPEHHILDGSAFLTALYNAGGNFPLKEALEEMARRGLSMPGATCGQWGICGAAASVGAALAIFHKTGPLSSNSFYKDNMRLTSSILKAMSEIGGPRCCKRNAYIALSHASRFVREEYGLPVETAPFSCRFYPNNAECIKSRCPFHPL